MNSNHFDYIIIGNGLAGLQLALSMANDCFFDNKTIGLIDKSQKKINDKTWCFWEKGNGKWEHLISKKWDEALFFSSNKKLNLKIQPYTYKSIRAIDLYTYAKFKLSQKNNISFIIDEVIKVEELNKLTVTTKASTFFANHVFDSTITKDYFKKNNTHTKIQQHFKGWVIETKDAVFKPNAFTMMDYRLKDANKTTFTYVLPFSSNKALVEFTYFTPELVNTEIYDNYLKLYIKDILKIKHYKIVEEEVGNIPMTTFPFNKYSTKSITKIGTAGGWVKGSTGYSFKHTEKKVSKIITNIKQGKRPSDNLFKNKYKFYDKIFLKVLHDENFKGEWIFNQFYTKNSARTMFKFLDEESSFLDELKIMLSLFCFSFIKAFFKTL